METPNGILARITDRRNGIMVEAIYQLQPDGRYKTTHWRLYTVPVGEWGTWYKIHGNQKKSINWALPLMCDIPPKLESELTTEEIERAKADYYRSCKQYGFTTA